MKAEKYIHATSSASTAATDARGVSNTRVGRGTRLDIRRRHRALETRASLPHFPRITHDGVGIASVKV